MRVLVQRSLDSNVIIDNIVYGQINKGLVLLVGFTKGDSIKDIEYLAKKVVNLRIFDDENGVMNKSLLDINASILSISQFTLYGDARKGNRPSYINALEFDKASKLYNLFNEILAKYGVEVKTGIFGADMLVNIKNDGPITIWLESDKNDEKR